jgi:hypothetical protein
VPKGNCSFYRENISGIFNSLISIQLELTDKDGQDMEQSHGRKVLVAIGEGRRQRGRPNLR